jgi:TonB family protein
MKRPTYSSPRGKLHRFQAAAVALLVTVLMFCMLPFTQFLGGKPEDVITLTPVDYAEPPPKMEQEEQAPPEDQPQTETPPELDQQPPPKPVLANLEVDLNTGPAYVDHAFDLGRFGMAPDAGKDLVFEISDLDQTPRCIKLGQLVYPPELKKFQLAGEVRLLILISREGRVKVLEVEKSAHPAFDRAAIKAAETSLYESPLKDGVPVAVRFFLPVKFKFRN